MKGLFTKAWVEQENQKQGSTKGLTKEAEALPEKVEGANDVMGDPGEVKP